MTATLVLPGDAPEADWLDARRKGVTASEIAALMGLSNWETPFALYHRKLGNLPEQEDNLSMAVGRHFEAFVAGLFAERHPEFGVGGDGQTLFASLERPWQMATPDRILYDAGRISGPNLAVLECKTDAAYDGWGEDGTDEIPVKYRCQVLWQCDVLGVTAWYVACLFTHSRKLRIYHGEIDDHAKADLELMRWEAAEFLSRIDRRDEPPVDWKPPTTAALKHLHPDVEDTDVPVKRMPITRYRAACRAYKAAEQRKKEAENVLRQLLGNGHRITDRLTGEVVARRDVYDVREHVRKASHVDRLVAVEPKQAREIRS